MDGNARPDYNSGPMMQLPIPNLSPRAKLSEIPYILELTMS